jgi:hypothetical protein
MGIEFTSVPEETKRRFQAYLDESNPGLGGADRSMEQ